MFESQKAYLHHHIFTKSVLLSILTENDNANCKLITAIKDNLSLSEPGYIAKMPASTRRLYIHDLKLVHALEAKIRWSIQNLQSAVSEAVNSVWMGAGATKATARRFTTWTILPAPQDGWVTSTSISDDGNPEQTIHFDMIEGTLYIDGQLLGRLPEEFSRQDFFQQFFGNRVFLTYPSYLQGMAYMLASPFEEHEIHFGFREGNRFMRVRPRSTATMVLEFLPPSVFLDAAAQDAPDLPLPLIQTRVHWLDLHNRMVLIRPRSTMWKSKSSDWIINIQSSQGFRRSSLLVDPRSLIFGRIVAIIEPFEDKRNMVIFQPPTANITVDLPGLELSFRVNSEGLLASRQLRAFIDADQGTYVRRSKDDLAWSCPRLREHSV